MSDVARARGPAVRRRERRLRAFWLHEQLSLKMAAVTMSHHSSQRMRCIDVATQTSAPTLVNEYIAPDPAENPASAPPVPVVHVSQVPCVQVAQNSIETPQ